MLPRSIGLLFLAMVLVVARAAAAEEAPAPSAGPAAAPEGPIQLPSWMSAEVVKAAVGINMTDAQQHEFNEVVGDYVTNHFAMIQKEAKREAPDLEQRVKSRDNALVRKMDTRMHEILTKEQWPAYENYKKVLRAGLKP